jgi:hypothetical protein
VVAGSIVPSTGRVRATFASSEFGSVQPGVRKAHEVSGCEAKFTSSTPDTNSWRTSFAVSTHGSPLVRLQPGASASLPASRAFSAAL